MLGNGKFRQIGENYKVSNFEMTDRRRRPKMVPKDAAKFVQQLKKPLSRVSGT